jgi:uncharacterized protein
MAETGNGLARTVARAAFASAVERIRSSSRVRLIFVTENLLDRALNMYARRADKTWGVVDCARFLVMQDEGITEAFTNDEHFKQAGFTTLLPVL